MIIRSLIQSYIVIRCVSVLLTPVSIINKTSSKRYITLSITLRRAHLIIRCILSETDWVQPDGPRPSTCWIVPQPDPDTSRSPAWPG